MYSVEEGSEEGHSETEDEGNRYSFVLVVLLVLCSNVSYWILLCLKFEPAGANIV